MSYHFVCLHRLIFIVRRSINLSDSLITLVSKTQNQPIMEPIERNTKVPTSIPLVFRMWLGNLFQRIYECAFSIIWENLFSSKYLPPSEQVECNESWDDSTKTWTHLETMCCASSVPHDCSTENVERSNREPITSPMESSQEISASTASTASTSTQEAQSSNENVSELETAAVTSKLIRSAIFIGSFIIRFLQMKALRW